TAFATDTLPLGAYLVTLTATGEYFGQILAEQLGTAPCSLSDLTPPLVSLLLPAPGLACGPVEVRVQANDLSSGVDRVFVLVDGEPAEIALVPAPDGSYAITLPFPAGEEGLHHLAIVAVDAEGNASLPSEVDIALDLSPPEITVNAPAEASCTATAQAITFVATDAHLGEVTATLDGQPFGSGTTVSDEGSHELIITATDDCGR
ncbi:MAG: hypothetical protein GY838_09905, partial [bacterium]|nr:hypothetical protein [bacterium]